MAATIEVLKEMIVDLKVDLLRANTPHSHCPFRYCTVDLPGTHECGEVDCGIHRIEYLAAMREHYRKEVAEL